MLHGRIAVGTVQIGDWSARRISEKETGECVYECRVWSSDHGQMSAVQFTACHDPKDGALALAATVLHAAATMQHGGVPLQNLACDTAALSG